MNKGKKRITYWEFDFKSAPRKRVRYVNPKTYLDRVIPVCLFIFTTTVSLTLWCGTGNSISDFAIRAEGVENITQTQPEMVYSEPAITPTPSPSLEPSPSPSIAPKTQKEQITDYIHEVFKEDANDAFKVLECENKPLNPEAENWNRNGTWDAGIFQINQVHGRSMQDMKNWKKNIDQAYKIFSKQGWRPWACSHKVGVRSFWQ